VSNLLKFILFTVIILFSSKYSHVYAQDKVIKIGSGMLTGAYYLFAKELCNQIEQGSKHQYKCQVITSKGTVENLQLLNQGKIDFALVQADLANEAYLGQGNFTTQDRSIRQVATVFSEALTIVVRKNGNIHNINDLQGRRVLAQDKKALFSFPLALFANYYHWTEQDFPLFIDAISMDASISLCNNIVDAVVINIAHPNGFISQIAQSCEIEFVKVDEELIDYVVRKRPYCKKYSIPTKFYPTTHHLTNSFATSAIIITDRNLPNKVVKLLLKGLLKLKNAPKTAISPLQHYNFDINLKSNTSLPLHTESQSFQADF
jgi:TRAP transporter TAXI family solute receptor